MSTDSTAEVALLRCPHADQPPLDVTWFRGQCTRCYGSIQVPKHSFNELAAGGRRVTLVCFECWTRADSKPVSWGLDQARGATTSPAPGTKRPEFTPRPQIVHNIEPAGSLWASAHVVRRVSP